MGAEEGSSPLARGTRHHHPRGAGPRGLIPARAGNTIGFSGELARSRAHPRSRGEHKALARVVSDERGSSPLARGTQFHRRKHRRKLGLIPARAGNTALHWLQARHDGAHPRSRGEHLSHGGGVREDEGSSPLARGTPRLQPPRWHIMGLIPARAGNTRRGRAKWWWSWAHPRSRGEHTLRCCT